MYIALIALLLSGSTFATTFPNIEWKNFKTSSIQLGSWLENYAQVRDTRSDETNGFELTPFISVSTQYSLAEKHLLIPELGWVIQQSENDIQKNIFFTKLDYGFDYRPWLRLRAGTSLMINMQSGSGGEDRLDNADTTEVYFVPEENRTTYNQTIDFGIELIQDRSSLRFNTYTMAIFTPDERLTTVSVSYNYNIPTEDLW